MSVLDSLPPDQRAVLQMVLQRGRSYDEIASLLSIDRGAVRQRALDAFDALAPVLPGPESALVTDYLLGQLPEKVAEQVYSFLQASEPDRAWAEGIASVLAPLASASLPEIPVGAPLGADDWSAGGLEAASDPPEPVADEPVEQPVHKPVAEPVAAPVTEPGAPARQPRARSSRRGGAILLSVLGAVIVAVVLVVVLSSGASKKPGSNGSHSGSPTTPQNAGTTATTGTTTTTATPALLAQLNLKSPTGATTTLGVAQVIREQGVVGVVILAQGVPANTAHNAYAVWLYNSAGSFKFVGFVRNLVSKNGKLSAEGELPAGAAAYHQLLITLETQSKPHAPGEVVLSGPFREHP
ncbi:MAG TPA: sigma factor-like helix-turn-helix DNA-binding protein [Solirubrobacteraceae bacterium]|nr:sigma factor-like helix-turn-helix DNA-binding protein [Solirubrobacteraceae bacterium]